MLQRSRCAQLIGRIFQRNRYSTRLGENRKLLKRAESCVKLAGVCALAAVSHMLNQIAEGNSLGHFERPLYLVYRVETADALGVGNGNGHSAFASRRKIALGGRMQSVYLQMIFAERFGEFSHGLRLAIGEMLGRAKNLNAGDFRLRNLGQQRRGERLIDITICRKDALHSAPVQFHIS